MDNEYKCNQIMHEVACKEERRMLRTFLVIGPLLIVCSWLVIVAVYVSVLHLQESKVFEKVAQIQSGSETTGQNMVYIAEMFWLQIRKDLLLLFLLSITIMILIATRAGLFSFPYRLKEINKYKLLRRKSPLVDIEA